ncbi:DUF6223 family protein [Microlunatus parietis]|uniref:DoxX-like family protein n=1 Tax=Microlunatus parietis TaxID=682979 RepID=A0A7Y9LG32_9ACTN|nr:DUF6223 family protein [Microlunatus parietis]NYE75615.1 hypothetical protein [Microlunatus parietis]
MNLALFITGGLLAAGLLIGGAIKLIVPAETLAATRAGAWVRAVGGTRVKIIGGLEILAALGLVLPVGVGFAPILIPATAVCVALLMIGAVVLHLRRREPLLAAAPLVYLAAAGFVAWGRFGPEPDPNIFSSHVGASYLSTGRVGAVVAVGLGLAGAVAAGLALSRPGSRLGTGTAPLGALSALGAGLIGLLVAGLVVLTSDAGIGTGNGRAGAFLGLLAGAGALALGAVALVRARRSAGPDLSRGPARR